MAKDSVGDDLGQLSRLLFDAAADKWYLALILEVVVSVAGTALNLAGLPDAVAFLGAIVLFALLCVAYGLRLWCESQYDAAEAMRRKSVLAKGLGWTVSKLELDAYRLRAGRQRQERVILNPLPADYYATQADVGPRRLAEMISESAYYTRRLYCNLRWWAWVLFVAAIVVIVVVLSTLQSSIVPDDTRAFIAKALYSLMPLVITANLLGLALRLGRLITAIYRVEEDLERVLERMDIDQFIVMHLIDEYNCQVAGGIPVHNRLFDVWYDDIKQGWEQRANVTKFQRDS
jgi:hypothetical protein